MSAPCPNCGFDLPDSFFAPQDDVDESRSRTSLSCPNCGLVPGGRYDGPTRSFAPPPDDLTGRRVAHFILQERLGAGGFGEVWLARDESLDRDVAVKLPKSFGKEMASLLHEARTAASLRHPNIVAIYEVGSEEGQVFIASEYIEGITLRDRLSAGKLPVEECLQLLIPICSAVHFAHERGVIHRDIKPANILLNSQRVPSITDFGIAKRFGEDDSKSQSNAGTDDGLVVGTAKYMSPEQAGGKTSETDRRSDVYSLGVMLFEMLTGEAPFRGNMRAIVNQKLNDDPPSPRTLNPRLARDLETICLKCLEREPAKRYSTAQELANELRRFQNNEPIVARPVSRPERFWRWCKRRPLVAGLIAGLFLSLTVGLTGVTVFWRRAEQNAEKNLRSLYRSRMNLIGVHLQHGDVAGVKSMLKEVSDDPNLQGVRGYEFGYYQALIAPLNPVANHGDFVLDVAVTRDGDLCASIGRERRIRVFDTKTGDEIRALSVDSGRFTAIEFSPLTGKLISGSNDGFLRMWDPRQDARLIQMQRHGPPITVVRFSADGSRMLSMGVKGPVRVWQADNLEMIAELPSGTSGGYDACFVGNGDQLVIAANDGQLRLWDVQEQVVVRVFGPLDKLTALGVTDDGKYAAAGSYQGQMAVWSLPDCKLVREEDTTLGRIDTIEFLKGRNIAAVATSDGQTTFVNMENGRVLLNLDTHAFVEAPMSRAANGKSIVLGNSDGTLLQILVDRLQIPSSLWHDAPIAAVAFLPGGQRLLASDFDADARSGEVRLWDVTTGEYQQIGEEGDSPANLLTAHPRGHIFATGGIGSDVIVRDTSTHAAVQRLPVGSKGITALAFSRTGDYLAAAPRMGAIQIYATADWKSIELPHDENAGKVDALTFSPGDQLLAAARENGQIELYRHGSHWERERTLSIEQVPTSLCFCEEGALLAIGTDAGEIHFWEPETHTMRRVVKGHSARVSVMACLPNQTTIVTGGRDRSLKLWDTASGELSATMAGHFRQIFALDVASDGKTMASGALDHEIRLWRGSP